jgi:hypothetical protein
LKVPRNILTFNRTQKPQLDKQQAGSAIDRASQAPFPSVPGRNNNLPDNQLVVPLKAPWKFMTLHYGTMNDHLADGESMT